MIMFKGNVGQTFTRTAILLLLPALGAAAQPSPVSSRQFAPGTITRIEDLPASGFRKRLEELPESAKRKALEELRAFHFTELDLNSLRADNEGAIFYEDNFPLPSEITASANEQTSVEALAVTVPVSPFPGSLVFHSRPGAPNVLYLNFCGETVTNTAWNTGLSRTTIPAVAFSTDTDFSTFSSAEQAAIKSIWQRVAEDYAPFNIDVTTERPATFGTRTAHALITRNTDANGNSNPSPTGGGTAYVNKFATPNYSYYRPAWVYFNKLSNNESFIAEAVSHEIGHNMGLSHDGETDGTEYYAGHGSGDTSWGPIMGTGYNRNVTQWSKGEYFGANNTEDDLAIIAAKVPYLTDDHGNTFTNATPLVLTANTNIVSTTPETDPTNSNPANKGVLERNSDADVFSFSTGTGPIRLTVYPWITPSGTRGGNLDVLLELYDQAGVLLATTNPASQTFAQLQRTLNAGTYYLVVRNTGAGNPTNSSPTGYTAYATIGQYFISGYIVAPPAPPTVQVVATVNQPAWGSVTPTNAAYPAGSSVQLLATPATYYRFATWTNDAVSTANPLTITVNSNIAVKANFAEILTTNRPTPQSWLASYGYTNNFEIAVTNLGANGLPLWKSYIAGLNPNDPNDTLRLALNRSAVGSDALSWNAKTGRVYAISWKTNFANVFVPVAGASGLPWPTQSFTNTPNPALPAAFYRLEVWKP